MEYASLRGEILKRIEMRQQIVSVTLTLAGIFLLTQVMAIGIALANFSYDVVGWSFLGIDIVTAIVVIWLMRQAGRYKAGGYQ